MQSMTGFARIEGAAEGLSWIWEARSVNGKGLDIRSRLPHGLDLLEQAAREAADRHMARGNVTASLSINREATQSLVINREAFDQIVAMARELGDQEGVAPPSLDGLLRLPGVMETATQSNEPLDEETITALRAGLEDLMAALGANRAVEGGRLLAVMNQLLEEITGLVSAAAESAGAQPDHIRERLLAQIDDMTQGQHPVSEERLAQEVTILATRADVREEIDRLKTHLEALRDLLADEAAPGRRLGFLCQELLREANTLCSKSSESGLTAIGLDLKVAIDRLREQALNVE
jgi:uncharacterized protein (TIGR00255 family)